MTDYYLWEKDSKNVLYKNIYDYYVNKGFVPIILRNIITLLQLSFITVFTTFATTCIEWDLISHEKHTLKCYSLSSIFSQEFSWLLILFMITMCLLIGYKISSLPNIIRKNYKIKQIYNNLFNIQDKELSTLAFSEIVTKIKNVNKDEVTDLDIINTIMVVDNYMIAFINKDILNLNIPFLKNRKIITRITELGLFGFFGIPGVLTMTLFNDDNTINQQFVFDKDKEKLAKNLKNKFRMVGLVLLLVSPILFVYLIGHFLFRYAEQIKNSPGFLTIREWNLLAKYKFRDFNELQHLFNIRLNKSYEPSKRYVSYFDSPIKTMIFEFLIFTFGAIFVVVLLMVAWETLLIGSFTVNSSALVALTILGATIGILRSNMPKEHKVYEYHDTMKEIVEHIHYIPEEWIKNAHHIKVLNEFTQLFSYKILNWILELTSVLYMPFIFMFSLANNTHKIVDFMQDFTVYHDVAGNICKFALLNMEDSMPESSQYGKLEMSLINFKDTYPEWNGDSNLQELYRQPVTNESMAFSEMLDTINDQTRDLEMEV
jgi:autophagy-related protein 9